MVPLQIIAPLIIAAIIPFVLAVIAWQRRRSPGAYAFMSLMLAVAFWTLAYVGEVTAPTLEQKLLWLNIEFIGITAVPTTWVALASRITGQDRWINRRNLTLLAAAGFFFLMVTWTNDYHHLFRVGNTLDTTFGYPLLISEYAIGFWVFAIYMYTLLALGAVTLVRAMARAPRLYRGQAIALITGAAAPWVGNILFISGMNPLPGIDLTPFGFGVTGLAFGWALTRYQLLDLVPVARDSIFENMTDGVLVLDPRSRVIEINPAAQSMMGVAGVDAIGLSPRDFLPGQMELIERFSSVTETQTEVEVPINGDTRYFDLRINPIKMSQEGRARLIVFRDITTQKKTEHELRNQKQLFENLVAIARATTETPSLEATFKNILSVAAALTGAQVGSLFLLDGRGNVTNSFLARGDVPAEIRKPLLTQVMDLGLAGWAVKHDRTAIIADTHEDTRWVEVPDHPHPVRAALAVPITSGSSALGVLTLEHDTPGHFTLEHASLLEAAANQMALALRNAEIHDEQENVNRRQVILYKVLRTISGHLDPETVLQVALNAFLAETRVPGLAILLPSSDGKELVIKAASGKLAELRESRIPSDKGISGRVFRSGRTENIADTSIDPDFIASNPNLKSELSIPLLSGRKITGILSLQSDQPSAFEQEDILLAESIADAISLALLNALLYAETQKRLREQTILRRAGELISSSIDLKKVLETIGEQMAFAVDATSAYILSYDATRNLSTVVAEYISPVANPEERKPERQFEYKETNHNFIEQMLADQIVVSNSNDADLDKEEISDIETYGVKTLLYVPFQVRGVLAGYAELWETRRARDYSEDEIALCRAIAQQAAIALQRARLFEDIQHARREAETANKTKTEFITVVAHELKGPMTTIKGFAEMLTVGSLGAINDAQQNFLGIIQDTVDRMTVLVSDLTDISRIEAGNLTIKLRELDLYPVLSDLEISSANMLASKNQTLTMNIEAGLPAIVADPNRLVQILTNLVSNAHKYTPAGGDINIEARPFENGRNYVEIALQDNGIGISLDDQQKLFGKFFRSQDELAREAAGTGLGLNITRHLVELQGGKIWCKSQLRQGTTFYFTIPAAAKST